MSVNLPGDNPPFTADNPLRQINISIKRQWSGASPTKDPPHPTVRFEYAPILCNTSALPCRALTVTNEEDVPQQFETVGINSVGGWIKLKIDYMFPVKNKLDVAISTGWIIIQSGRFSEKPVKNLLKALKDVNGFTYGWVAVSITDDLISGGVRNYSMSITYLVRKPAAAGG